MVDRIWWEMVGRIVCKIFGRIYVAMLVEYGWMEMDGTI